jgi:hypothetical protein
MPKNSIELDFRVRLPRRQWSWSDESGEGWVAGRDEDGALDPPWLLSKPDPSAPPDAGRVVDRSGARLYSDFRALARYTASGEQAALPDAIVRFAERYGFLGEPFALYQPTAAGTHALPERPMQAESLQYWGREIQSFYDLDRLAEALQLKDIEWLRERIVSGGEAAEFRYVHIGQFKRINKLVAAKDRHPVRYERLQSTQAFGRAWTHLSLELNKRLTIPLEVFVPPDPKRLAVAHPRTLIHALYLRLYQKDADIEWERRCQACGDPLPADATIRRLYCDDGCRMTHHNPKRRREAPVAIAD